jgi:N-methylhydantoinase A
VADAILAWQTMAFGGKRVKGRVLDRARLSPGTVFRGPAIVVEESATTVVPPDFRARVDRHGNLILRRFGIGVSS